MLKHWEKWDLTNDLPYKVHWDANKQALQSTPILQQHWLSKKTSGMCGLWKMMKIWGHWDSNACPCLGESETTAHVLSCPDKGVV